MPYILKKDRNKFASALTTLRKAKITSAGELNFLITKIIHQYMQANGQTYQHYNDAMGALEGAKLELYRRRIQGYEDQKIAENGDV